MKYDTKSFWLLVKINLAIKNSSCIHEEATLNKYI